MAAPAAIVTRRASTAGVCAVMSFANRMERKATNAPVDRSTAPETITAVMPMAITQSAVLLVSRMTRLARVKKCGVVAEKMTTIRTRSPITGLRWRVDFHSLRTASVRAPAVLPDTADVAGSGSADCWTVERSPLPAPDGSGWDTVRPAACTTTRWTCR
jgi:hypothetical protein